MKFVLSLLLSFLSWNALACLPPPPNTPSYTIQKVWFKKIFDDAAVESTVLKLGGLHGQIETLSTTAGYEMTLNNGCSFKVETDFSNTRPGTCPELLPLKVVGEKCP